MATMEEEGVLPEPRRRYLHMSMIDSMVWSAFLEKHGPEVDRVWYDVWCGDGEGQGVGSAQSDRRLSDGLYCKRIDAVCLVAGLYRICEVKPYGNHVALGQALMYGELFKRRYPELRPVELVVVCATQDKDCGRVMALSQVTCVEVGAQVFGSGTSTVPTEAWRDVQTLSDDFRGAKSS